MAVLATLVLVAMLVAAVMHASLLGKHLLVLFHVLLVVRATGAIVIAAPSGTVAALQHRQERELIIQFASICLSLLHLVPGALLHQLLLPIDVLNIILVYVAIDVIQFHLRHPLALDGLLEGVNVGLAAMATVVTMVTVVTVVTVAHAAPLHLAHV